MTYPSVKDKEYFTLWAEDDNGNEYPFIDGDYKVPSHINVSTLVSHSCFANSLVETTYFNNCKIAGGSSSYPKDLALAMCRPSLKERLKSIFRTKKILPLTSLDQSIRHACRCERCMNALAYAYGLDWGYPAFSDKWEVCGTVCDACKNIYSNFGKMNEALS